MGVHSNPHTHTHLPYTQTTLKPPPPLHGPRQEALLKRQEEAEAALEAEEMAEYKRQAEARAVQLKAERERRRAELEAEEAEAAKADELRKHHPPCTDISQFSPNSVRQTYPERTVEPRWSGGGVLTSLTASDRYEDDALPLSIAHRSGMSMWCC
jgi:hypothetical protein